MPARIELYGAMHDAFAAVQKCLEAYPSVGVIALCEAMELVIFEVEALRDKVESLECDATEAAIRASEGEW